MEHKKVLGNYAGSGSEQRINEIVRLRHVKDLVIDPNYFKHYFQNIDEKFFDYFDFTINNSPEIHVQRFYVKNALKGEEISQGKIIEVFKKYGMYQEHTLCHIAQILHFPSFDASSLSSWTEDDCFLLKNKYGNLCWLVIHVSDHDMFSCPNGPLHYLHIHDFEHDQKLPSSYFMCKHKIEPFHVKI